MSGKIVPIELLQRPLYINDNGIISCNNADCAFTFEHLGRRTTVSELLIEMGRHMKRECPQPQGKSQYEIDCEREGLPLIPLINDYPADIDDAKEMRL